MRILEALDQAGEIKWVFFPHETETEDPQVLVYNHIIEKYSASGACVTWTIYRC